MRDRKFSLLGLVSVALAILAGLATRAPIGGFGPMFLGSAAAILGLLSLILAGLSGRAELRIPLLGFAAGLFVAGLAAYNAGQWDAWTTRAPATIAPVSKPAAAPSIPGTARPAAPAPAPALPRPAVVAPTPAPAHLLRPEPNLEYQLAVDAVARARVKLEDATKAVLPALANDPSYRAAKADADAAEDDLQQARQNERPGSVELMEASRRRLAAKSALQKLIAHAADADPGVIAARKELAEDMDILKAVHPGGTDKPGR